MYKLTKKEKKFLSIAFILALFAVLSSFFLEIKLILIIYFSLILILGHIFYKEKITAELIIAFLIALAWTSYYPYEYTTSNLLIEKINLFPLISWTFGLVLLREIYERMPEKFKLLRITLLYLIVLGFVEFIGYHLLGIRLNSNFPGLLGLDIIHGPLSLKIFYLTVGPIYLLITDYLKVK
ncbi:hypothetical protein CMI46_02075 [Candidatus Pacearchaeota archaeon]|nr:hypothetical protein [Candidatus Pacearchaeota archaeon]|tara:strand:- start:11998 stop:12540 length:543 start_codon:yes stop_codon:yes gene_type:complete